ncbi:spore cortex biosynthesis protein YabQ [Lentibacillus cibarius]|uniref:Spore cortex biosynthesis protein YabQ n=1 Tax=Lentibacillus cibarius TaxID=2583219 RepID=A0A5S3QKF8_9BACI|nr:spore cortex biosynthesis protein YabQ [Lentibacillus cibarius]TMN22335.1 spore cortex biosynthesis protein YabQ [Lentibacillus cibarius]
MTLSVQFLTMISMTAGGFYLGMILDTYRRLSIHWKSSPFMKYFMEIIFWLTQTMVLYYVLFRVNSGELRFYVFLACLLGFSMYQGLAANVYKAFLEHMIRVVTAMYRFCKRTVQVLVITPVLSLVRFTITIAAFILHVLITLLHWLFKIIYIPCFWLCRLVFRMLPSSFQVNLHKVAGFYSKIENTCRKRIKELLSKRR